MKNLIKQLLRENLQLADKVYFNSGKLSPEVKKIILSITNGDPYTKIMTDIYYNMLMQGDITENDVMSNDKIQRLIQTYNQLKEYNKNVFPIKGFNINGVEDSQYLVKTLENRQKILNIFDKWPSIAKRNMKNDIRTERDNRQMNDYLDNLEYADSHISQLNNRNENARMVILQKIFKKDTTLDDVLDFIQEKENLLGGTELTRKQIGQILKKDKEEYDELKVKYNKGNIMVIEVDGPNGIKEIGCNSVWCFTYNRDGATNWNDWYKNSTNGYCYIIIDFSESSDSEDFMHVLTKPLLYDYSDYGTDGSERLYNMADRDVYDEDYGINDYIERFIDLPTAMKVMNFGIVPPKEKKKKQKFVDPNQLALDLNEGKTNIKNILRENLNDNGVVRLYHRIGNKKGLDVVELIRSVFKNGLIPHDNGEVGPVTWFSSNYDDYAKNGVFVVAYDYDKSKNHDENDGVTYSSWSAPFGYEQIPFNKLDVVKIPIIKIHGQYISNEDVIRYIDKSKMTPETFNEISGEVKIFRDLFNMYVQPYIDYPNFLDEIDQTKIKMIDVLV
jgi:hypothetical protein